MIKLLALATLLIAVSCTSTEQIFAEVSKSEFGMAVQSLLTMHTSDNAGRLSEISDLLYDLQAIIDDQQKEADSFIETNRGECSANIDLFTKQSDDLKTNVADSREEQADLEGEQSGKNTALANEKINNASTVQDYDQAKADLTEETTKYTDYKASFDDAILACEEAVRLLVQLGSGSASSFIQRNKNSGIMFVQLSQKFADVKNVLENHIKKGGPAAFVQPIIDILSELSSQTHVDVEKVDQIVQLVQTLLKRLREGLFERTSQNTTSEVDLNALIATLNTAVQSSTTQIAVLETRLAEIQTRLDELVGIISNLDDLVVVQEKLVVDTQGDCDDEETRYSTETSQRTTNLSLLDKLIQHFESEVTSTVSNISDNVTPVDNTTPVTSDSFAP